jgi:hypothetical protein
MESCMIASAAFSGTTGGLAGLIQAAARCATGPRIRNIRIDADPVSSMFTTGLRTGRTQAYSAPSCGVNLLCRHGVDTCVQAVRNDPADFSDLKL